MQPPRSRPPLAIFALVFVVSLVVGTLWEILWNWIQGRDLIPDGDAWTRLAILCALLSLTLFGIFRGRSGRPS